MATYNFLDKTGLGQVWAKIKALIPTKTSDLTNDSGFIDSYTETDPVFSASPAAGITSTDISNWDAKVSDDHKWNGVALSANTTNSDAVQYIPQFTSKSATSGSAGLLELTTSPTAYKAVKYDHDAYLYSTTPSANDSSTKVATTAYVKAQGYLTLADLPVYDGGVSST